MLECYTTGSVCYGKEKENLARGIIYRAYKIFSNTKAIKNLNNLLEICPKDIPGSKKQAMANFELTDPTFDKLSIIISFENILKVLLFLHGGVIHCIDRNVKNGKFQDLHKSQKKRPLLISEIIEAEKGINYDLEDGIFLSLLPTTISIHQIIDNLQYRSLAGFPEDLAKILSEFNKERNNIHFLAPNLITTGSNLYKKYEKLKEFINNVLVPLHNDLANKINIKLKRIK